MPSPPGYAHFPSEADLFYFCTTSTLEEEDLDMHYAPPSRSSLKIGVVVLGRDQVQLLDLSVADMLGMISRSRIEKLNASEAARATSVEEIDVRYINDSGQGSFSVTSVGLIPVTNSFANAPQLDVIIIPGSFTTSELSLAASDFLTRQATHRDLIAVLSISSGVLPLIQTGLLHRKKAAAPPSSLSSLSHRYPDTLFQQSPWTRHDKIWSSSSAVAAIDMLAAMMRECFWDRSSAVECALGAAGVPPLR